MGHFGGFEQNQEIQDDGSKMVAVKVHDVILTSYDVIN